MVDVVAELFKDWCPRFWPITKYTIIFLNEVIAILNATGRPKAFADVLELQVPAQHALDGEPIASVAKAVPQFIEFTELVQPIYHHLVIINEAS